MRPECHTMITCMKIIAEGGVNNNIVGLGLAPKDVQTLTGPDPWTVTDQQRMRLAIETIVSGSQNAAGFGAFEVCVEYYAAVVAMFVHKGNWFAAAACLGRRPTNERLARNEENLDGINPRQIFALMVECEAAADGYGDFLQKFSKRVGWKLDAATPEKEKAA